MSSSKSANSNQEIAETMLVVNEEVDNKEVSDEQMISKATLIALFEKMPLPIINATDKSSLEQVQEQRLALYQQQRERTASLYLAPEMIRPTYLIPVLRQQFLEYQRFLMSKRLDQRGVVDTSHLDLLWNQLHIVDDLITQIVQRMPAQRPTGWQISSGGYNYLRLPTVGRQRIQQAIADQGSLNSYVLGHFGVMSYTNDRAFFIGHCLGYLFCCYYLAHLSIPYGVTPLHRGHVVGYDYATLDTPQMVRLLQAIDESCKKRIYQLAVVCARLSDYRTDKRIEKMLIAEVNGFDKKQQQQHLDTLLEHGLMPDALD
ncbi:hypothetical protein [Psychrobacter sp. I-STPA6b]|uniref:hypothetical protein n=1 Tax=Psychrobacter sp. I-STPA6b TaxID=2585718 RepID=UPI001D0C1E01|nr:hypothetical protein [Psychrobacter sp. I-STPA6b]